MENLIRRIENNLLPLLSTKTEKEDLNKILTSLPVINRKYFTRLEAEAYLDTALPIGFKQTISQPSTVVRMLILAKLKNRQKVLEIGTGSGWNASLIGYLVYPGSVLSLDIVPQLVTEAKQNLEKLKASLSLENSKRLNKISFKELNIFNKIDDWPEKYNRIIITAGINQDQEILIFDLAQHLLLEKGILICPYTQGPLLVIQKENGTISKKYTLENYVFVPLLS